LWSAAVSAVAQDSASVLAGILADKGTISKSELAQVQGAGPADRVRVLTELLAGKGLISAAEVARVNGPAKPQAVASAAPAPSQKTGSDTAPAVISQSHFPVTIYGTLLV